MKSFKKIMAGVCSLVMLSSIATYAVSAELGDSIGSSIGTSGIGTSGNIGDSDTPSIGESDTPVIGNCSGVEFLLGDVNGDGVVKSNDLLLLKKYLLGLAEASEINMLNSDLTEDGRIKSNDLLILKKALLGLIPDFKFSLKD